MLDTLLLSAIARQLMTANEVDVGGKRLPVRRTSKQGLRTVTFTMEARQYAAIKQNPAKPTGGASLPRSGHQVVQFKDVQTNRFVAVAVDGEVKEYGAGMGRRGSAADRDQHAAKGVLLETGLPRCLGKWWRAAPACLG